MTRPNPDGAVRALGTLAAVLALGAAFAGSPYAAQHGRIDVSALAHAVQHEDDHVDAVELAQWIRERRRGLRIVDVRSRAEYETFHVPGAERVALDSIAATPFRADETIVLYSEGGAHAAQAWVFLRALGYEKVYFLRGGLYEWLEQVMNPTLRAGALPADSAAFARVAALSRYFGGTPRFGVEPASEDVLSVPLKASDARASAAPSSPAVGPTNALLAKIRRRGC